MNKPALPNRRYLIILLVLVALLTGANIYQWSNHTTTVVSYDSRIDSMIVVRVQVEKELASTAMELEKYRGISNELDSLLNNATATIKDQEKKIQEIVSRETDLDKQSKILKQELAKLKKMRDDYLEKIDQLVTENKELKERNDSLNREVNNLTDVRRSLESKVRTAAELKVEYLKIQSFKKKGNGKLVESSLAKKTNRIQVCFTVMDNKFASQGDKIVYVVVTEPTGKVLASQSRTTLNTTDGEEIQATASYQINYNGKKQDVCLSYDTEERILTSGNYNVEVYIDGKVVSSMVYLLE